MIVDVQRTTRRVHPQQHPAHSWHVHCVCLESSLWLLVQIPRKHGARHIAVYGQAISPPEKLRPHWLQRPSRWVVQVQRKQGKVGHTAVYGPRWRRPGHQPANGATSPLAAEPIRQRLTISSSEGFSSAASTRSLSFSCLLTAASVE